MLVPQVSSTAKDFEFKILGIFNCETKNVLLSFRILLYQLRNYETRLSIDKRTNDQLIGLTIGENIE